MSILGRAAIYAVAHLVALVLLVILVEVYEPELNGIRFDSAGRVVGFAISLLPPLLVGFIAVRRGAVLLIAAIQAMSPLLLIGNMVDPDADLTFAVLLWWFPLPAAVMVIGVVDRWRYWVESNR